MLDVGKIYTAKFSSFDNPFLFENAMSLGNSMSVKMSDNLIQIHTSFSSYSAESR